MVWFRLHVLAVRQKPAHSLQLLKGWWAGNCSSPINTALFVAVLGKSLISLVCWRNGNLSSSYSVFSTGFGSSNLHGVWKQHSWKNGRARGSCPSFHSSVAAASNKAVWLLATPRWFSPNLWSVLNSVRAAQSLQQCCALRQMLSEQSVARGAELRYPSFRCNFTNGEETPREGHLVFVWMAALANSCLLPAVQL